VARLSRAIRDNPITAFMSVLATALTLISQWHNLRKDCPAPIPSWICAWPTPTPEEDIAAPHVRWLQAARVWTSIKHTTDPHILFAFTSRLHDPVVTQLATDALKTLDDQAWQLAVGSGSREAITTYTNTWSAFSGRHLQDAQLKLNEFDDDDAWNTASREDSPRAYRQYLTHPWTRHAGQAQRRLDALSEQSWQSASAADTIEAYRAYLADFPDTKHQEEAQNRIRGLGQPQECDYLVANPNDPARIVAGIRFESIDAERAIPACEVAVTRLPKNPRFRYQLARAYQRGSQPNLALPILQDLIRQKYIAAYDNLGWLYLENKAVPQDFKKAIALFKQGAAADQPEAMTSLGEVYQYQQNFAEAKYWYEKAAALGYAEAKERLQKLREALASASSPDASFPLPFPLPFPEMPRTSRR